MRGYENGDRVPPEVVESALCNALGLDPDGLRAQHDDEISDYYAAAQLAAGDDYDATAVTVLLPGRTRAERRRERVIADGSDAEVARLRAAIARLRADPEHLQDIENAPPLSEAARSIIALAFGMVHGRSISGGDAA